MYDQRRSGIAAGVLLVLFGVALLALQLMPGLRAWLDNSFGWPLIIVGERMCSSWSPRVLYLGAGGGFVTTA